MAIFEATIDYDPNWISIEFADIEGVTLAESDEDEDGLPADNDWNVRAHFNGSENVLAELISVLTKNGYSEYRIR